MATPEKWYKSSLWLRMNQKEKVRRAKVKLGMSKNEYIRYLIDKDDL